MSNQPGRWPGGRGRPGGCRDGRPFHHGGDRDQRCVSLGVQVGTRIRGSLDRRPPALRHLILEAAWASASSHMVGMGTRQTGISTWEELLDLWREFGPALIWNRVNRALQNANRFKVNALGQSARRSVFWHDACGGVWEPTEDFHENGLALVTTLFALTSLPLLAQQHG
jgi:hypothetical protein